MKLLIRIFSYCCYIPHKGQLYELDGLKEWPVNHGPCGQQWLEKAKQVISGRISKAREKDQGCHDIRYNLMSVVPSRRIEVEKQCTKLHNSLVEFKVGQLPVMNLSTNVIFS